MVANVNASRTARPSLRDAQAATTRQRVLSAAQQLFESRGYTRTTVNDIADAAGVSAETIYKSLGGKSGLLDGIIDAAIAGPDAIPYDEQPGWRNISKLSTPEQRLTAYVAFSCDILERTRPVHTIIRSAAESEPRAADLRARQLRLRLTRNTKHLGDFIGPALRHGITLKDAAERYCALSSPELYELLTVQLGWSKRRHQQWLRDTVQRELLETD